jgi:hypothetical protein
MTVASFLSVLRRLEQAVPPWRGWARQVWCRRQRRELRAPRSSVVWIRAEKVPWAVWGAQHGFFEVERMDGLMYLRAAGAPVV